MTLWKHHHYQLQLHDVLPQRYIHTYTHIHYIHTWRVSSAPPAGVHLLKGQLAQFERIFTSSYLRIFTLNIKCHIYIIISFLTQLLPLFIQRHACVCDILFLSIYV
jgi:hypothetical protein